jgi:hypothetical protein
MFILDQLKEYDLLLLSKEPLPTEEVKKLTNADFLLKIRKEKGKILAMVQGRRKKDQAFITLRMDKELHKDYALINIGGPDLHKMHVYYFDSLVTSVREFKTIKSCEFFPTADIILQPSLLNELQCQEVMAPERLKPMQEFIHRQRDHFNESQLEALDYVTKMKKEDFLLI